MSYYLAEATRVTDVCYANTRQLSLVIGTRKYIDNNIEKDLTLDRISRERCTSKFHLLRLFKKYYGQTPKQYLTDKRIEKSKEFLNKGWRVTETCFEVGFESPSSFCTLFKERVGLTPTAYQKRATLTKSV